MDIVALVIALLSLSIASASFFINQKWKKLEFVGQEMRAFRADYRNQVAMRMLDWNEDEYLHPEMFKNGNPKIITICDKDILKGLGKINTPGIYNIKEKFVRDCFDNFLDSIEALEIHIEQGLIPFERYDPYLRYYVNIMINKKCGRKETAIQDALSEHMTAFGYDKAQSFFKRFGI